MRKELNFKDMVQVNGGDASWENHVTISEPSQGDPRCCDCGSHLDYKYTSNNEHYFQCTGCGNKFLKKLCGIWFRA